MILAILFCAMLQAPPQDPTVEEARKELHAWYADRKLESPYRKPLRALGSEDPKERAWASAYLVALFKRTVYDEEHGLTPETRGYKMGGGPQDDAAEMRHHAAEALSEASFHEDGRDALAVALYLFKEDPYEPNQIPAIKAIAKIRTQQASDVLREVVLGPHPAFQVLIVAIKESALRKLHGLEDNYRTLANHYHSGVRTEARAAVKVLGLRDVPEVKPGERITPSLEKGLRRLAQLPFESIPADAPWKRFVETTHPEWSKEPQVYSTQGWLLGTGENELHILRLDGTSGTLEKDKTVLQDGSIRDLAEQVIKLRARLTAGKDKEAQRELDEVLGQREFMRFSGSKEPTLAEGMMAAWSLIRGDRDTAAGLVVPLLEQVEHERAMVDAFRDLLAIELDHRMLGAFCSRKYEDSLALARHLSGAAFDGWYRQGRARDLGDQLPKRIGVDFVTLTLATTEEWETQSKKLSRDDRIRHLAERLRLIYAVQNSIPGGVDFAEDQSRSGPTREWKDRITLINPYVELYNMNLSARECLLLFPALESRDFFLAYNLQRFMPNKPIHLFRVRWIVESLINSVAQKELIDRSILEADDVGKVKVHLEQAVEWLKKEGDLTLGGRLEREIAVGEDWAKVTAAVLTLYPLDRPALARGVESRLPRDAKNRSSLFMVASHVGASTAVVDLARREMEKDSTGWAALVVAKYGDREKKEGIASLAKALQNSEELALQVEAIDPILNSADPGAEAALVSLLSSRARIKPSIILIQRLFERGKVEARDVLIEIIGGKRDVQLSGWSSDFHMLMWELQEWSDDFDRPLKTEGQSGEDRERARREAAKAYASELFERLKKGEKGLIKRTEPGPPFKNWSGGPKWIRRL